MSDKEEESANSYQVGGSHYKQDGGGEEHWDRAWRMGHDIFQYQITKYVERHKKKNGLQDLLKAKHFLQKYIELVQKQEAKEKRQAEYEHAASIRGQGA